MMNTQTHMVRKWRRSALNPGGREPELLQPATAPSWSQSSTNDIVASRARVLNLSKHPGHLDWLVRQSLSEITPRVLTPGLGWGPRTCISNNLLRHADGTGLVSRFKSHWLIIFQSLSQESQKSGLGPRSSTLFLCSTRHTEHFPHTPSMSERAVWILAQLVNPVFWFGCYLTLWSSMNNTFHFNFGKQIVLNKNTNSSCPHLFDYVMFIHLLGVLLSSVCLCSLCK